MNYDDWLEQPYQEAAERDEAIDAEVERLLEGECNPHDAECFLGAIDDACLYSIPKEKIAEAIAIGVCGFEAIGKIVWQSVCEHLRAQAESIAADRYNKGLTGDDRDYDPD